MIIHQNEGVNDKIEKIVRGLDYIQKHVAIKIIAINNGYKICSLAR